MSRAAVARIALAAAVAAASLILSLDALLPSALYSRSATQAGEHWRWLSAHFAHLNTPHLLLNLAAWLLIWIYGWEPCRAARWLFLLAVCAAGVSAGLHLLEPDVEWHGGLSGVLHGLFAAIVLLRIADDPRDYSAWVGAFAIIGKLWFEALHGPMPSTEELIQAPVLVEAHFYGAVSGAVAGVVAIVWRGWRGERGDPMLDWR